MSDKDKQERLEAQIMAVVLALLLIASWFILFQHGGHTRERDQSDAQSAISMDAGAVPDGSLSDLDNLTVNDNPTPPEKYSRVEQFGPAWKDVDHNGCDTRNDILARDLARPTFKPGTHDCVVLSGTLAEPYTGATIEFQRGDKTSALVQIDHVVALADAWRSGAWQWDAQRRQEFANDPENLLAVDGQANEDKSASSADQWLPPNTAFRCDYVKRQIAVKNAYGLSVTRAEQDALAEQLSICSG